MLRDEPFRKIVKHFGLGQNIFDENTTNGNADSNLLR